MLLTSFLRLENLSINLGGVEFNLKELNVVGNVANKGKAAEYKLIYTIDKKEDGIKLQIGANEEQVIGFSVDYMRSRELGLGGITIDNVENAQEAIGRVDEAINIISSQRGDLGRIK